MADLLPCPFCDAANPIPTCEYGITTRYAHVVCRSCGARGPFFEDDATAKGAWNLRPASGVTPSHGGQSNG